MTTSTISGVISNFSGINSFESDTLTPDVARSIIAYLRNYDTALDLPEFEDALTQLSTHVVDTNNPHHLVLTDFGDEVTLRVWKLYTFITSDVLDYTAFYNAFHGSCALLELIRRLVLNRYQYRDTQGPFEATSTVTDQLNYFLGYLSPQEISKSSDSVAICYVGNINPVTIAPGWGLRQFVQSIVDQDIKQTKQQNVLYQDNLTYPPIPVNFYYGGDKCTNELYNEHPVLYYTSCMMPDPSLMPEQGSSSQYYYQTNTLALEGPCATILMRFTAPKSVVVSTRPLFTIQNSSFGVYVDLVVNASGDVVLQASYKSIMSGASYTDQPQMIASMDALLTQWENQAYRKGQVGYASFVYGEWSEDEGSSANYTGKLKFDEGFVGVSLYADQCTIHCVHNDEVRSITLTYDTVATDMLRLMEIGQKIDYPSSDAISIQSIGVYAGSMTDDQFNAHVASM